MRVAVTGATGTIGRAVVRVLRDRGDDVVAVSRNPASAGMDAIGWDGLDLSGFDGVIHLAGSPIDQRWTDEGKKKIRDSRIDGTRKLVEALRAADPRPRVLVSQSAEGYYQRGSQPVPEESPPGSGFLSDVVQAWEAEARKAEELGVRVVLPRTGVVLSKEGGALPKMLTPFKLGVGGPVAGGAQPFPWVDVRDAAEALVFLLDNDAASGPVNLVSPEEHTNKTFTNVLGRVIRRPTLFPVPSFAIKILYGEMGSTVTQGSNPDPTKLQQLGYTFKQANLENALRSQLD
ncbi:MAG TPA: TIGR01777 family oxidoreductase [Thermoleophilaceae bacterium]|nr:TIGR01777 family oxidoreductase [Thermoleophilaceae bacterium]